MNFNSLEFFNYQQLDNRFIISNNYWAYRPDFEVNFYLNNSNKLFIIQTFELFYQFYGIRPVISSLKRFDKYQNFNLKVTIRSPHFYKFFQTLFTIRTSSKTKLITFDFRETGFFSINVNDFITIYPFQIRFYDFHSWRNQVVIQSKCKHYTTIELFTIINFFYSFYKRVVRRLFLC